MDRSFTPEDFVQDTMDAIEEAKHIVVQLGITTILGHIFHAFTRCEDDSNLAGSEMNKWCVGPGQTSSVVLHQSIGEYGRVGAGTYNLSLPPKTTVRRSF